MPKANAYELMNCDSYSYENDSFQIKKCDILILMAMKLTVFRLKSMIFFLFLLKT